MTALKTISMYLRAAKTEAEEAGESTDGMANSVSELREELLTLTKGKVDIMLDDKTFKSTYEIMKDLSKIWEDLADIDKANIIELIGGKRNANAVTSLLTNFEDAENALQTASTAAGSAYAENEKYLDSIAGKVDQLTASFEAMSASVLDSSIVKWVVDLGTALINAVAKLQELSLLLPFVVATLVTLSYIKLYKQTQDTAQQVSILVNRFVAEKAATDSLIASYWSLTAAQQKEVLTKLQEKVASGAMTATTYQEITAKLGLTAATTGAKVATDSYTASIKALLASNPIGWIIMAISLIPTLISWISKLHKSDEELIEDANKIIETYSEAKDSYESNIKSLESMRKEFEQLSQGVDANGKNVSLTASQYETYLDLIKQIVDISPDVCKGYDDEGNAIVNYTTILEDAIAAQETYMNNQRNMYLGSGEKVFDGKQAEYKKAKKSLGDAAGANDLKDKSLDDALNPGFWESIFHADEAQAKLDAYKNAFAELGIQWRTGVDTWRESTDSVMQMYENADEIMVLLRQSGAYTEEELVKIEDRLHGLAGSYSTLKNIETEQVDYLAEWSKDQTWYDQIPVSALDEFYDGLMDVNDPLSDYETNLKNASKFGTEFSKAIATDDVKELLKLSEGLKDGSVSLEDYNKAVSDFIDSFSGSDNVKNTLSAYLVGLSDNAIVVTKDYTKSLSDLSDTISNLQDDYKLLEQAEKDMAESGSLSADTIKSIQEAMSSGENYLDYLEIENGAIKLNTQAWKDRAAATLLGDFEEIQKEVAALELQNAELKEKIRLEEEERKLGNNGNIHTQIIQQYTNEIEANNQKIRENQELLELYGAIYDEIANDFYNAFNYDSMVSGLDSIGSSVSKLVSSMQSLAEGTALTKQELAKLALAYPELLEASDLFTDGSIQGQQAMLDNVLKVYEAEYDATIDTKIAELTATKQAFEDRLEAEKQKATIIDEIANAEVNNTAEYRAWLTNKLADFNEIEEANYITYQDGVLGITEEALNARLSDEYDTANKTASEIWAPMSTTIATAFSSGGTAGLSAMETVRSKLGSWISKIKNAFLSLARTIASAITGKEYDDGASTGGIDTSVSVDVGDVKFDGKKVTINGQSLDEWTSEQQRVTADRIDQITNEIGKLDISIGNLEKLKGLDLKTIYGDSGKSSSSSSKEVEEYIANVDEYYAALKRLESALAKVENLENELSHTDDPAAKIKLYDQLIDAYKEEAEAERNLINKRTVAINSNVQALRNLGFEVEYNAAANDLFIKNLDHVNELTATSKGNYDTLQEATNALRKETEELINTTEDLNDSNRDSIDNIEDLAYEIQDVAEEIIDCIEEVYQEQIDAYNDIIEKRKEAIESAKDEYDYEEDVAEKVKEIAELQARIDKLSLDNSREAQAEKAALIEELQEKQKELNDTQSDHAYDEQIDALDKMSEKYEEEKNAELDILRESIGTVQDLGTVIDTRVTNAWKNAKKAVKEYGQSVAGLNGGVVTNIGTVPKYHSGGVVGGNATGKEEILALLEAGEIVLNDQKQDAVYKIIDFQSKLAERLGVALGSTTLPLTTLDTAPAIDGMAHGVINTSTQTVFNPEFTIEINHNGDMSDDEARRYGEEIADTAIAKLYNAFERKGISNHNGAKLKP